MKNFVHVDKLRNCQGARADRNAASTIAAIHKGTRPVRKNNPTNCDQFCTVKTAAYNVHTTYPDNNLL